MNKIILSLFTVATIFIVTAISYQAIAQEKVNKDWVVPKEADQIANPLIGKEEATKAGKKLFQQQCVGLPRRLG